MARAGDFNGDGISDLAVSDPYYDGSKGMVAVVFGKSGGLSSVVSLPSSLGTSALAIRGNSGLFGANVIGIPGLYGPRAALVVAAPFTNSNAGTVHVFRDLVGASFDVSNASATLEGTASVRLGYFGLGTLRGIPGIGSPAISFGLPRFAPSGRLRAWFGPSANVLQDVAVDVANPEALVSQSFSRVHVSSAYSGTSLTGSFIGSSTPDIVVSQRAIAATPSQLLIIDGDRMPAMPGSPSSVQDLAPVRVDLPTDWGDFAYVTTAVRDLDGDDYADIAIGEGLYGAGTLDGRVIVLH